MGLLSPDEEKLLNYTTTLEKELADKVSGVSIKELLPDTTLFAHVIPWHTSPPSSSHSLDPSGYNSEDLYVCINQVKEIKRRGFDGVWVTWQGSAEGPKQRATRRLLDACEAEGLKFLVALDQSSVRPVSSQLVSDYFKYAYQSYTKSPAYFQLNGKPVLSEFGLETLTGVDMNLVLGSLPPVTMLYRNTGGLSRPQSAGAYAWLDDGLPYLDWFYSQSTKLAKPGQYVFGSIFPGFDNSLATWAVKNGGTEKDKVIDRRNGQLWLDTIAKFKASGCKYGQVATWNDHEEGSGIEFGIEGGSEHIHHVEQYITDNGTHLAPFDPNATYASGTYQVYAKSVGLPSIKNIFTGPVPYVVRESADTKKAADLLAAIRAAI